MFGKILKIFIIFFRYFIKNIYKENICGKNTLNKNMVKYILALKGRIFRAFLYENFYKLEMDNKKPREGEKGNIMR